MARNGEKWREMARNGEKWREMANGERELWLKRWMTAHALTWMMPTMRDGYPRVVDINA